MFSVRMTNPSLEKSPNHHGKEGESKISNNYNLEKKIVYITFEIYEYFFIFYKNL